MKTFTIIIQSKNKSSKNYFFSIWQKISWNNLYIIKKHFQKKNKNKKITILKSPHVNKKSQEQFEIQYIREQLTIKSVKTFKYLILLKKLNFSLFSDINFKLKSKIKKKFLKKLYSKIFVPENLQFKKFLNCKNYNLKLKLLWNDNIVLKQFFHKKINLFLKIFDLYGESFKYKFE